MIFFNENIGSAQWKLHRVEGFLPTTIKSHVVKIVITWSIRPDENNNIGIVYSFAIGNVKRCSDSAIPNSLAVGLTL